MKVYELTYLIIPSLASKEAEEYHKKIKEIIEKEGGVPGKEQLPSKKNLAYLIKNCSEGYLACVDFEIDKESVKKLTEKINKESQILRYLLLEKEAIKQNERKKTSRKKKSLKPEKTKLKEIDEKIDEML